MLNITRRHRIEARRTVAAARDQLSRLPLIPGMAVRVEHRHDRAAGYLVTVAAWWDHPSTGVRIAARYTVSAAAGPIAAEQAAERVVRELTARLRTVRVVTGPAVHVPAPPAPPAPPATAVTPRQVAAALAVGALIYAGTWAAIRLALWAWEHMGRPAPRPDPDEDHGASCVAVSRHYLQHVHPDQVSPAGIRGWAITGQDPRAVHVGDPFPHVWDDCPCQPATYHDPDALPCVVHNAEDDRP